MLSFVLSVCFSWIKKMNINGFLICFILLVKFIQTYEGDNNTITIGVISNGRTRVSTEKISRFEKNVTLVRHWVDTSEVYHIFRSIQTLDADADVDVIVLFDYDPTIIRMPDLFTTTRKKLIKWGERTPYTQQSDRKSNQYIDPDDICGSEQLSDFASEDPYCIHDDNITVDRRSESLVTLLGPKALTVLVKTQQWKTVYIFYETSTETEASDLVDSLSREGVLLSLFNINKISDLNSLIHRIYTINIPHNKDINIIVLCRFACARELLRTANAFDSVYQQKKHLLKLFSRWLVAVYGHSRGVSRALQACAKDLDNVAVVAFPEINGNWTKVFRKTLDSIVLDVLQEEVFGSHLDVKRAFLDRLETAAATWSPKRKCLAYNIDTLLHKENGRSFSSAGYIEVNGNVEVHSDLFPNSKFGYNKRHFKVATLPYKPFVMKRKINGTVKYQGFCIDLLQELANKLNFTFTLTEPSDAKWGTYEDSKNLSFNGLIGMLQREEVDIVAAPISTTSDRSKVVDFSYPFFYEYTSVLMKKPDVNATKWRTLIDPFKWEVLVSIGLSLTMVTILAFLLEKYNPFYDIPMHAEERQRNGGIHTWHSSFWYMYGALLCQGGVHLPDSTSGRTLVSFWWLFCIIIVGTYSGNLIAFLTVTKEKPLFNTLAEMTKQKGSFKWGTMSGTYLETTFLNSNNPTYKAVGAGLRDFNRTDPDVLSVDPNIHIRKVKEGKYAWIGDKTYIENAMATECSLMSIKEDFLPLKYAFGFVRNSPHTALFSKQTIKLHEGGLFQIWKRQWWPNATFCAGNTLTEAKPISLMDVQSAFYVCAIGVVLGLFAFLLEVTVYKCRERTQKAIDNLTVTINGDIEIR